MIEHPDDVQFLDVQPWAAGRLRGACDSCEARTATIEVGSIERASGPAYGIRYCRACVATLLQRARRLAERRGEAFTPAIPERTRL